MGIIAKQGSWNFIILYLGVIIGMINKLFLATNSDVMSREELGFLEFVIATSMLGSQIGLFGAPHLLNKYFPKYRNAQNEGALLKHGFWISLLSMVVVLLLTFIASPFLFSEEQENPLFQEYFYSIFPLVVLLILQEFLGAYLCVLLKTIVSSFVKDLGIRVYQLFLFLGLLLDIIDYRAFFILYILGHLFSTLAFLFYCMRKDKLSVFWKSSKPLEQEQKKELYKYRITTFPVVLSGPIINQIDKVMLTSLIPVLVVSERLEQVAIFAISAYMARLITIPSRAISSIATPVLGRELENENYEEVANIYRKSALNQLIFGLVTFVGIWVNLDEAYALMPDKGFEGGAMTFLFIGLANLFHAGMGLNGAIVINSKYYWFSSIGIPVLAAITLISNWILIPLYGISGAALATLISLVFFNLVMFVFVYLKFNMQPFTWRNLYVAGLGVVIIWICSVIPTPDHIITSVLIKSFVVLVLFALGLLLPKISEDLNDIWNRVLSMIGLRRKS